MSLAAWLTVGALVLLAAAGAATWTLAERVASSVLVPTPYGLQSEFVLGAVEDLGRDADGRARVRVQLPLPAAGDTRQFARVDADGRYGLLWDDAGAIAHGLLGPVEAREEEAVTRSLTVVAGAAPLPGADARLDVTLYRRDPMRDHALAFEEVEIAGAVGPIAAWWLGRESDTAVVMLHGRRRGERSEALRALPTVAASGVSVLVSSYRNHDRSAMSPDGFFHYGASEADDLLAALAWLRERGVERVVLVTYSMGGALAMVALERWPAQGPTLLGLTMDAPLVDPTTVFRAAARRAGLPQLVADAGLWLAQRRSGVDYARLDLRTRADALEVPLLLHATVDDGTIPIELIDAFAARVPAALLRYRRLDRGDHVEAWNVDQQGYEAALAGFLDEVLVRASGR